jgi:hypothetical protein
MIIKISSGLKQYANLLLRQTPHGSGVWRGAKFVVNEPVDYCDWWVVCHAGGLLKQESVNCDPNHLVFISMEPPDWGRPTEFYNQFSHIIAVDRKIDHPNVILRNGLTWWAGLQVKFKDGHQFSSQYKHDYDSFKSLPIPKKENRISVITSKNKYFHGHKKRLQFLDRLAQHEISQHIDFFGGHHHPVDDKLDALLGYKYHLALENSVVPNYWTEKLADPLLAWCKPIYYGCPNIDDFLPSSSVAKVDLDDFESSVNLMKRLLISNDYEKSISSVATARSMVLDNHNIFQLITDVCDRPASSLQNVTLNPHSYFQATARRLDRRVLRKMKSIVKKIAQRTSQ